MRGFDRSAFVNSIAGFAERLANLGRVELVDRILDLVREHNARSAKPAITPRHKFWTFGDRAREKARQRAEVAALATAGGPETVAEADGVEIVADSRIDRVLITFPGKPDRHTIDRLKSAGWKWAPSSGAWQRKLTDNARRSALEITGLGAGPAA